ncbi:hypothetical protein HA402_015306 [Bradysia odoriphaga]|nr:hypothetical protein HA402_015306 [Bradysia odoriphaga]
MSKASPGPSESVSESVPPTRSEQVDVQPLYANRICKDIRQFFTDPIPDIMLSPDPENLLISHAVIIGPEKTPYEGGFFYFYIKLPHDYPFSPPVVKLMTTNQNTVRFNPNLYKNGKVCLSILNTWMGPQWSSGSTLSTVLLSIQSIMNDKPFFNEPGASVYRNPNIDAVKSYNDIILHETIRVAVIGMMKDGFDTKNMPSVLKEFVANYFKTKISYYEKVIDANIRLDGQSMNDPFNEPRGLFQYKTLKLEMEKLKQQHAADTAQQSN